MCRSRTCCTRSSTKFSPKGSPSPHWNPSEPAGVSCYYGGMRLLILIGIPFRFALYLIMHTVIGLLSPDALPLDEDFKWVITGMEKHRRNNGRQLI